MQVVNGREREVIDLLMDFGLGEYEARRERINFIDKEKSSFFPPLFIITGVKTYFFLKTPKSNILLRRGTTYLYICRNSKKYLEEASN